MSVQTILDAVKYKNGYRVVIVSMNIAGKGVCAQVMRIDSESIVSEWVTKARYCEMTGLSDGQVRARIDRKWTRGVHFVVDGKATMINLGAVAQWWNERSATECDQTEPAEKSKFVWRYAGREYSETLDVKPSEAGLAQARRIRRRARGTLGPTKR